MGQLGQGIDVYVCDKCNAIVIKTSWNIAGKKCPECGSEEYTVRGCYFDQRIMIDGFMAQGDQGRWAEWAENGFLTGEPAPGLEKIMQR